MKSAVPEITYEELDALLAYNKLTGLLTWKETRSRLAKAGDEAGGPGHHGTIMVGVQGRTYPAARLIFLLVTTHWPKGKLRLRDNDPNNLRWNNLVEEAAHLSQRHSAVYQRRRRKILQVAKARIAGDPSLRRMYNSPQNLAERDILKRIAAEVEDDMMRNHTDPAWRPVTR